MKRSSLRRPYAIPGMLALASLAGLIGALVGDGPFDLFSWVVLGGLLVVMLWAPRLSQTR